MIPVVSCQLAMPQNSELAMSRGLFFLFTVTFALRSFLGLFLLRMQNNLDELFMLMHFLDAGKVSTSMINDGFEELCELN